MALLRKYEGKMAWVSADENDLNCLIFWYNSEPTQEQIDSDYNAHVQATQYDNLTVIPFNIDHYIPLIKSFINYIKAHPAITLTQYNTYLGTLQWYEGYVIKFFVFTLANGLADFYQVDIATYTETQMLLNVRNWIVANPIRKIAKIVFGIPQDF